MSVQEGEEKYFQVKERMDNTRADDYIIEVSGVTKSFGNIEALRGIDLRIKKGEFLTIFGPNGAGKTTLINILSNLMKPSSGTVSIGGINLNDGGDAVRRDIGVISHNTYLYNNLTPYENIRFYGKIYGVDNLEERVHNVIEQVGLKGRMYDQVGTFSRGMQQRLSLARALIHNPSVIFLDEPYTGLDQHAAHLLKVLLNRFHTDENRTTVMTTHNIERGLEMCDQVAIQVRGKILYKETLSKIDRDNFEEIYFAVCKANNQ